MTAPPPGGGFQSGDDFVAARVSIDIPTEGIAGLREITQEMDRFRTSVESANRSSETFSAYLERIAEAASQAATATENLVDVLERTVSYQNQASVGGAGMPQLNAPPQYTNPFAAQTLGMGGSVSSGAIEDVPGQLDALRMTNPRAYVNKMAASGQYRVGDITASSPNSNDIQSAANRISQRDSLLGDGMAGGDIGSRSGRIGEIAKQVLNEINPGAGHGGGIGGLINRSLGAMSKAEGVADALGTAGGVLGRVGLGGLGGLAAAAGPVAAVAGLGLAGYGLVQGAGSIYQDYKNMGSIRGGGAMEGAGYEMAIKTMSLNPFISGDQARQIVQQGLRDGYTGKEFDTITSMVATNLKDFNMEVGDSFKMLRKNVLEGGQSGAGFQSNMESLKQLAAQGGYLSLPALQQGYAKTSASLIDMGMDGASAAQNALVGQAMYSDNASLAGTAGDVATSMLNSPAGRAAMRYQGGLQVPPGMLPGAMAGAMEGNQAAAMGASNTALNNIAHQYWRSAGSPKQGDGPRYYNARYLFSVRAKSLGVQLNDNQIFQMFDGFIYGDQDPFKKADEQVKKDQQEQTQVKNRNPLSIAMSSLSPWVAGAAQAWDDTVQIAGSVKDIFQDDPGAALSKRWGEFGSRSDERWAGVHDSVAFQRVPMLTSIQNSFGHNGYEILDKGKVVDFDTQDSEDLKKLSSGQYRWRPKGSTGQGYTLAETPQGDLKQFVGAKTEVRGEMVVTLADDAKRLLLIQGGNRVPLTPHDDKSNAGADGRTPNNPPIGEGRGGR